MILILSQAEFEPTTEYVIDWLDYFNQKYIRLNGSDFLNKVSVKNGLIYLENIDLNLVSVIWNRRWLSKEYTLNIMTNCIDTPKNIISFNNNITSEAWHLSEYFFNKLNNHIWVTNFNELKIKKLDVLNIAKTCGLLIPKYLISSNKLEILDFLFLNNKIITKPISEVIGLHYYSKNYSTNLFSYTKVIENKDDLKIIPQFPSLFQEYIEKMFEIRVFFIGRKIYPMAIISQNDTQTKADFRDYNLKLPNRNVPYKFPKEDEKKIINFISKSKLTTGSIDIIKSRNNNYYFLEVNPVGQFGMTSYPTNYQLEYVVSKYLIDEVKKNNLKG